MGKARRRRIFLKEEQQREIYAICLLAGALFIIVSILGYGGVVGNFLDELFRKIFGFGWYIIPVALALWSLTFLFKRFQFYIQTTALGLSISFLSLISLIHLRTPLDKYFEPVYISNSGGYVGASLSYPCVRLFGIVGAYIILSAIFLVGVIIAARISLVDAMQNLSDRIGARLEGRKERKLQAQAEINTEKKTAPTVVIPKPGKSSSKQIQPQDQKLKEAKTVRLKTEALPLEKDTTYQFPPLSILRLSSPRKERFYRRGLNERIRILENTLHDFGVDAVVNRVIRGPTVTRFEIQLASGVKVNRVVSLADDIAVALASADVRILTPVPGKSVVGIEVPNKNRELVTLGDVFSSLETTKPIPPLTVGLGKDISGSPILANLTEMPHLLISGATGSGKTTCINAIIASILFFSHPDQVKLLLIDPKLVELNHYNDLPHLLTPVVTNPRRAATALSWLVKEMEQRFKLLAEAGTRNIDLYNKSLPDSMEKLPYLVAIIDELADLMMVAPSEVEEAICRLAQMGRAVGINLVVATQRPSVDIITGLIKANIPSRISFEVTSQTDSRVILDMGGAEKLVGRGDMLYLPAGSTRPKRVQGAFITEKEIEELVSFIRRQREPQYNEELLKEETSFKKIDYVDPLLDDAIELVVKSGQASISMLQRRLRIGYSRAARLIDTLEEKGIVGGFDGSRPRAVLISEAEFERMKKSKGISPSQQ